jgi:hypothetical protein
MVARMVLSIWICMAAKFCSMSKAKHDKFNMKISDFSLPSPKQPWPVGDEDTTNTTKVLDTISHTMLLCYLA